METRKSSCVNARVIPPAAYQMPHLLDGGIHPWLGYPPGQVRMVGTPPHLALAYPPPPIGVPPRKGPETSHWVPPENMGPVEVLWDGDGVNPPPPPRCGQTHL